MTVFGSRRGHGCAIPLINGRRSIRRAAKWGDGWHSVRIGLDELRTGVATLHELLDRNGRQPSDVVVSAKFRLYAPGTGPRGEPMSPS